MKPIIKVYSDGNPVDYDNFINLFCSWPAMIEVNRLEKSFTEFLIKNKIPLTKQDGIMTKKSFNPLELFNDGFTAHYPTPEYY